MADTLRELNEQLPYLPQVLGLVIIWVLIFILIRNLKRILKVINQSTDHVQMGTRTISSIDSLMHLCLYVLGVAISLHIMGVTGALYAGLTAFGIIGLVIGLAGQEIIANSLAGFTLVLDRPFIIGDTIQCGEFTGVVELISLRSTTVLQVDGIYLTLPNSFITGRPTLNYTRNPKRRVDVRLPGFDLTDMAQALPLIREAVDAYSLRLPETTMDLNFERIESGNGDIVVRFWVERTNYIRARSEMTGQLIDICQSEGFDLAISNVKLMK